MQLYHRDTVDHDAVGKGTADPKKVEPATFSELQRGA
jgi:hypothetical protein